METQETAPDSKVIFLSILGLVAIVLLIALVVPRLIMEKPDQVAREPLEVKYVIGENVSLKVFSENKTEKPKPGSLFQRKDKLDVGKDSEIEMALPDMFHLRLKENSRLESKRPSQNPLNYHLSLTDGRLLGITESKFKHEGGVLDVETPSFELHLQDAAFQVRFDKKSRTGTVGILRGSGEIVPKKGNPVTLRGLQKVEIKNDQAVSSTPAKVIDQDWVEMKEAYELIPKTAASEAQQIDLSKRAGDFFNYVFDHGTFYSPKIGFAEREFLQDERGEVSLKIKYDVFPRAAIVGMYIKTRNFNLSKFGGIDFDVRTSGDENYPESIRIELKSKYTTIRAFKPRNFTPDWQTIHLPFFGNRNSPITEMTVVFTNDTVGPNKVGTLEFRNFRLLPLTETPTTDSSNHNDKEKPSEKAISVN